MSVLLGRAECDTPDYEDQHKRGEAVAQHNHEDSQESTDPGDRVCIAVPHSRHADHCEVDATAVATEFRVDISK